MQSLNKLHAPAQMHFSNFNIKMNSKYDHGPGPRVSIQVH